MGWGGGGGGNPLISARRMGTNWRSIKALTCLVSVEKIGFLTEQKIVGPGTRDGRVQRQVFYMSATDELRLVAAMRASQMLWKIHASSLLPNDG